MPAAGPATCGVVISRWAQQQHKMHLLTHSSVMTYLYTSTFFRSPVRGPAGLLESTYLLMKTLTYRRSS